MNNFKSATKKISVVTTLSFQEMIEVPTNWTADQITKYTADRVDLDKLFDTTPDEIETYWRLLKKNNIKSDKEMIKMTTPEIRCKDCAYLKEDESGNWICTNCEYEEDEVNIHQIKYCAAIEKE